MAETDDDKPWQLPEKFHIAPEAKDRDAKQLELLAAADEQQKEWREKFASPGVLSPIDKQRGRALIIIDEYNARDCSLKGYVDVQLRELAEAFALVGRFDKAAEIHPDAYAVTDYFAISEALERDDNDDCGHGTGRQSVKLDVFSISHVGVVSLVKCSQCEHVNGKPTPAHVDEARAVRSNIRSQLTGLHPLEAKAKMVEMREQGMIR